MSHLDTFFCLLNLVRPFNLECGRLAGGHRKKLNTTERPIFCDSNFCSGPYYQACSPPRMNSNNLLAIGLALALSTFAVSNAMAKGHGGAKARNAKSSPTHVATLSSTSGAGGHALSSRPYYGGGEHTTSHGGTYLGGQGQSHVGGHYVNPRTSNRYGIHATNSLNGSSVFRSR
jgi:hypothetical protein